MIYQWELRYVMYVIYEYYICVYKYYTVTRLREYYQYDMLDSAYICWKVLQLAFIVKAKMDCIKLL